MPYTIGELAKRTGVTVRSLHHYDELGLLRPSGRSEGGYRLYGDADVARLHRILAYKQMGLGLKAIQTQLGQDAPPLRELLEQQVAALEAQIRQQQRLVDRLASLATSARDGRDVSAEQLIHAMAVMNRLPDYFDEAEMLRLDQRRRELGETQVEDIMRGWEVLIPEVRDAMAAGLPPDSETVRELARRWLGLVQQFTGGDLALTHKVGQMYQAETSLQTHSGIDQAMMQFLGPAFAYWWPEQAAAATRKEPS
ncbi:MAG: MerR family transcriptional regulator [Gammaproteobacteria bacterium]|nr:MerR family transcriptional regulator [Gammaproteobacteria bacterium]